MVTELRWLDLDPATHAFEPRAAEPQLQAIVAHAWRNDYSRQDAEVQLDRAILATHGAWAAGWRWSPGRSGPVHGWCCSSHSVLPPRDRDPQATVERALGALASWRRFLEELATRFTALRAAAAPLEHAAAELLALTIETTCLEEAWYLTFSTLVAWYAEPFADDIAAMRAEVKQLVAGRFESWEEPGEEVARATCEALAAIVEREQPRDALAEWLTARKKAFPAQLEPIAREPVAIDAHQRFIDEQDRARDPVRAERMTVALEMCRGSARSGLGLSLGQLAEWQACVLGAPEPVPLRTGDAFAKAGRERYPLRPDLHDLAERLLAEANDRDTPPAVRAARAYLDVCFLHPFSDGNARAARLALDHVLTSAGLALRTAAPVFVLSRAASDATGAASFARMIDRLCGPRTA